MRAMPLLAVYLLLGAAACQGEPPTPDEGHISVKGSVQSAQAFEGAAAECGLTRAARGPAAEGGWRSVIFSTRHPEQLQCTVQWLMDHPELKLRMDN